VMPQARRIESIFGYLDGNGAPEGIFLFNRDRVDKNFLYVTGLENGVFENCGVLFERSGKMYVFTSALEEEAARSSEGYAEIVVFKNERERNEKLKSVLGRYGKLGLCFGAVSHGFFLSLSQGFPGIEWVDAGSAFRKARMIKTDEEIEKIRKACEIASRVAESIPGVLREGMTELDLSAEIDYLLKKSGAGGPAFRTIAAFAVNSSMPHYAGGNVRLENGNVVLVDFGAEYRGYASDITQTYLTGKPGEALVDLYKTVLSAQRLAFELIRDGAMAEQVDEDVRRLIDAREPYRGRFIHSLGHSLGLDVHDDGYPSREFDKRFSENMVLTVEPGVYLPGVYGVRLEDDIVVKKEGCVLLTTAKKELRTYEII
jgi:Xaa-Pro aminopeptidase